MGFVGYRCLPYVDIVFGISVTKSYKDDLIVDTMTLTACDILRTAKQIFMKFDINELLQNLFSESNWLKSDKNNGHIK